MSILVDQMFHKRLTGCFRMQTSQRMELADPLPAVSKPICVSCESAVAVSSLAQSTNPHEPARRFAAIDARKAPLRLRLVHLGLAAAAADAAAQGGTDDAKDNSGPTVGAQVHNDEAEGIAQRRNVLRFHRVDAKCNRQLDPTTSGSNHNCVLWI